jgi:hypothetical protein
MKLEKKKKTKKKTTRVRKRNEKLQIICEEHTNT